MKSLSPCLTFLALLPALALAATPEDPMEEVAAKASAEIRKHYDDPIIERQACPFPGLVYLTAFERAYLNEDPIVPQQWFATPEGVKDGKVGRSFPFEALRHHPENEAEARELTHWLFSVEQRWSRVTSTQISFDAAARRVEVILLAEFSQAHPMFRQGTKPGQAVITVQDGRWSMQVDDPFIERVDKK